MNRREKGEIRSQMGEVLRNLPAPHVGEMSRNLTRGLATWLGPEPRLIATFAALPGEPNLLELSTLLPESRFCYPRVRGNELSFHEVSDPESLAVGSFGIREPIPELHPTVSSADILVFLCPGVAFAPSGVRLGRGKGFYDRALVAAQDKALFVGVGFTLQVLNALPAEPHDIRMHFLATEQGTQACDGS